jgi:2-methylisocitrate lyase-like PEP mutase family enzyme
MTSTYEVKTFGNAPAAPPQRRSKRLRMLVAERYSQGKSILAPTAHDCVTAKIFEEAGVEHINVAGAASTAVWTGEPECGVVTTTEMIQAAHRILGATQIPGKVSIAQGGGTLATIRAFREYERTGAALIQIEDQPTGHFGGYIPGKEIIPLRDMVAKIKAVRYAREDPDVIIAARCDAKLAVGGGMDELLKRCRAYVEAGAESLMPHGMETMDEWELVGREMRRLGVPLIASLSAGLIFTPKDQPKRAVPTVSQLEDMGWTMLNYANHLLHLHMTITQRYVRDLMQAPHRIDHWLEDVMNNGERMGILGLPTWRALEEAFENPDKVSSRYEKTRQKDNYVYSTLDQAREKLSQALRDQGIS